MNRGMILYVEDSEPQRKALKKALELRGFTVLVAGDVESARALIEQYREQLDVIVLDMRLEDPKWPQMTGADVAIEYFHPQTPRPPEFLINSAYSEVDYYKLALKLGVATYLQKSESRQEDVVRHVRALTIRRALSAKRSEAADRIQAIVISSRNRMDAVVRFCREELESNFQKWLGAPFIFLLTEDHNTTKCAGEVKLPESLGLYETIQAMVFAEVRNGKPFILDAGKLAGYSKVGDRAVLDRLDSAAFLPLTIGRGLRLSLGILKSEDGDAALAEPPIEMATVLARHLESAVIELFLTVLTRWAEYETEKETKRKELIRSTSEICLYVGRNMVSDLHQLKAAHPELDLDHDFEHLQSLVHDLHATGNMLDSLAKVDRDRERGEAIRLNQFVQWVWEDLDDRIPKDAVRLEGDCVVTADEEDMLVIISRVLQWFAQRFIATPAGVEPHITIKCEHRDGKARVIFEDRSRQLDSVLRKRLFDPFAENVATFAGDNALKGKAGLYLPLFLAKMLVEERYDGGLEDISDELADAAIEQGGLIGHRFLMWFPDRGA